jgi:pyruvate-formate lyase-activating enzyme
MSTAITTEFHALEPAIDPNNRISFLLDWELTMKCNLDCSYCLSDLYGGHDNSRPHPPKQDCLRTIDFMFEYVDLYMSTKPRGIRYVMLNVYGGESLNHPDIVEILAEVRRRYQPYADRWHLTVTTTTNAIVSDKKLQQIIPLIDEFTVSYHTENTPKQKAQFKRNLLMIAEAGRRQKCVVLMHREPDLFADAQQMIEWLNENRIRVCPDSWMAPWSKSKANVSMAQRRSNGLIIFIKAKCLDLVRPCWMIHNRPTCPTLDVPVVVVGRPAWIKLQTKTLFRDQQVP